MIPAFDCLHTIHDPAHWPVPWRLNGAARNRYADAAFAAHIDLMDRGGVQWALLYTPWVYWRPQGIANTRALNDWTAAYRARAPQRFPAALGVVEPMHGEEGLTEVDRCLDELGLQGISFHSRFHGLSVENYWTLRYVERIIERGGVPVLCAMGETPEEKLWKIARVAKTFPDTKFLTICTFSTYETTAESFGVADQCPNLLWSTPLAYDWDMVEPFARTVGADRLLFGSDIHVMLPSAPPPDYPPDRLLQASGMAAPQRIAHLLPQMLESQLAQEEKAMIAWKNAAELFGLQLEQG